MHRYVGMNQQNQDQFAQMKENSDEEQKTVITAAYTLREHSQYVCDNHSAPQGMKVTYARDKLHTNCAHREVGYTATL